MLSYTLKNVLKNMKLYADDRTLELVCSNKSDTYTFIVTREKICVEITSGDLSSRQFINDIEECLLPKNFTILEYREKTFTPEGENFKQQIINVRYEALVFIELFRMMKEKVFFTFLHKGNIYDCYYIDGKAFYIQETDDEYRVMGTDLFKLPHVYKGYSILTVNSILDRVDYKGFMEQQNEVANSLGKRFVKYLYGQVVS